MAVTSRHWKCQVVRDFKKFVFAKILEAVRLVENIDGSS